jgi:hypothetical protein
MTGIQPPGVAERISFSTTVISPIPESIKHPIHWVPGTLSPEVKQAELSDQSSAKV